MYKIPYFLKNYYSNHFIFEIILYIIKKIFVYIKNMISLKINLFKAKKA